MIATMIHGLPDPEDLRKYFRALRRAQRDLDLRPDRYTHYYTNEFPERFHALIDTRRWGPGERLVFEPYTKETHTETFYWIARHVFRIRSIAATGLRKAASKAGLPQAASAKSVPPPGSRCRRRAATSSSENENPARPCM